MKVWLSAKDDFKKALELDPDDAQNRDWLMSLFLQSERYEDALDGKNMDEFQIYHYLGDEFYRRIHLLMTLICVRSSIYF